MAKQTTTGGAYANYQVIKTGDTTGSSKALAQGMANIAGTVAQNSKDLHAAEKKAKEDQEIIRKDNEKKVTVQQHNDQQIDYDIQKRKLGYTNDINKLGEKLGEDVTREMWELLNKSGDLLKDNDREGVTTEQRKSNNDGLLDIERRINMLSSFTTKSTELRILAKENVANSQSIGHQSGYKEIELEGGGSDNGRSYQAYNGSLAQDNSSNIYLKRTEDGYETGGSGFIESVDPGTNSVANMPWELKINVVDYNQDSFSTTFKMTQAIAKSTQAVVNQTREIDAEGKPTGTIKPELLKPTKGDGGFVHLPVENSSDGNFLYSKSFIPINTSMLNKDIDAEATLATSNFTVNGNRQDQVNILKSQLYMPAKFLDELYSSDPEVKIAAKEKLLTAFKDKIKEHTLSDLGLVDIKSNYYITNTSKGALTTKQKSRNTTYNSNQQN
tara:strand:- start:279 stop:1604 length:1326 start_codon:yes stop_codon:yes gene_type:complete